MHRFFVSDLADLVDASGPVDVLFDPATGAALTLSVEHNVYSLDAVRIKDGRFVLPAAVTESRGQSLLELPVRTRSGDDLGTVHDVVWFWETGKLHQIVVGGGRLASLLKGELLIAWQDILEIRPEEIVVREQDEKARLKAAELLNLEPEPEPGLASGA